MASNSDALSKQIEQHFWGMLTRDIFFNPEKLQQYLKRLQKALEKLAQHPSLHRYEAGYKQSLQKTLTQHTKKAADKTVSDIKQHYENQYAAYQNELKAEEDSPDSLDWDWDGPIYSEPPPTPPVLVNPSLAYQDIPKDLAGLIEESRGEKEGGLAWKFFADLEYSQLLASDTLPDMLLQVDGQLNRGVICAVLTSLSSHVLNYDDQDLGKGFIARAYIGAIAAVPTAQLSRYNNKPMTAQLIESLNSRYAHVGKMIEHGQLDPIRTAYQLAFDNFDLLGQQRQWYIFMAVQDSVMGRLKIGGRIISCSTRSFYNKAIDRALRMHHRIYPDHRTQYLRYGKTLFDMFPVLQAVTEVGAHIKATRYANTTNNIVTAVLCFVVQILTATETPNVFKEHVEFIPVNIRLPQCKLILTKNPRDNVFRDEAHFLASVKHDQLQGYRIIQDPENHNTKVKKFLNNYQLTHHSERVLFELLKQQAQIDRILTALKFAIQAKIGKEQLHQVTVYATVLLAYSTNSVCGYCTPSMLALQASHKSGYMELLAERINAREKFKTRGFLQQTGQDPKKFRHWCIVNSHKTYTPQAKDIASSPYSRLSIPGNAIDLKALEERAPVPSRYFFEFVNLKIEQSTSSSTGADFKHKGPAFVSGGS